MVTLPVRPDTYREAGLQTRADLEELADNLGNLGFDLTFSVEFPLIRIETFQTALYEAMDLSNHLISFPYMREWTSQNKGRRPLWCGLAATAAGAVIRPRRS